MSRVILFNLIFLLSVFNMNAQTANNTIEDKSATPKFRYVEQMPEPGYNISEYIGEHLVYPTLALQNNIQGRVLIKFVIRDDGTIDSAHAINNPYFGYGLEEAAVDLINRMPKWEKPGKQNGKPVKVYYTIPITFKLDESTNNATKK
jgi:TonB family protein